MLFNEKIQLFGIKLPPQNHSPKTYQRLYRIIKSKNYIKLLENKDLFDTLVKYNRLYSPEYLTALILSEHFKNK